MVKRIQLIDHSPAQPTVSTVTNTPPAHGDGVRVIVGDDPTGAFIGHEKEIAWSYDGEWNFDEPQRGWRTWIADEDEEYIYNGFVWVESGTQVQADWDEADPYDPAFIKNKPDIIGDAIIDLGDKDDDFSLDLSESSRQNVNISGGSTIDITFTGLLSDRSVTSIIYISSDTNINFTYSEITDEQWGDGEPLDSLPSGRAAAISINTSGTNKSNMVLNWIHVGWEFIPTTV